MIRRLRLPIWWLAFPPLVDGVYIANPHVFVVPLILGAETYEAAAQHASAPAHEHGATAAHEGAIPGWSTWVLHDLRTGMTVVTSINSCCGDVPANFTLVLLKTLYPETFVVGGGPKATTLFKLSRTTSFTPGPGWVTDRSGTSRRRS
jgi:predicted cobalt transporter CbtA